jgi:hypothetical protein
MCIACEMALLIALDDLPATPPPGFPGAPDENTARFACEAPDVPPPPEPQPTTDERKP